MTDISDTTPEAVFSATNTGEASDVAAAASQTTTAVQQPAGDSSRTSAASVVDDSGDAPDAGTAAGDSATAASAVNVASDTAADTTATALVSGLAGLPQGLDAVTSGVQDFVAAYHFVEHGISLLGLGSKGDLLALARKYL
ncbi:hypothetical protein [Candidatus Pantoea multigeneris]|uniref:Uncharacterized protein n=1 Tax=Candidatus Pantoea multigeneris TaxID=2608357 RepID=A0ABX0RAI3_9GAMM|nr:hypothetical protein [Pantoea multigeneris]NIF21784.1 hypothetical protein [Pantoea multigeneris]